MTEDQVKVIEEIAETETEVIAEAESSSNTNRKEATNKRTVIMTATIRNLLDR